MAPAERIDVIEGNVGWIVTNHHQVPRSFLSSHEAVAMAIFEAKRLATEGSVAEVHVWRDGKSEMVFEAGPSMK